MSQIPKYINPFNTQELNMGGQVEYKCTVPPQKLAVTLYWPNTYNIWQSLWENRQQTYNIWPTLWENWQNTYDIWETVEKMNLSIHSNCEKNEPKHTLKQSSEDEMKKTQHLAGSSCMYTLPSLKKIPQSLPFQQFFFACLLPTKTTHRQMDNLRPAQDGQHSPGSGATRLSAGQLATLGQVSWRQLRWPSCNQW